MVRFGDILSVVTSKNVAVSTENVKIKLSWNMEELIWRILNHPSIFQVYDVIDLKDLNLKLYIMPKNLTYLEKVIKSSKYNV